MQALPEDMAFPATLYGTASDIDPLADMFGEEEPSPPGLSIYVNPVVPQSGNRDTQVSTGY